MVEKQRSSRKVIRTSEKVDNGQFAIVSRQVYVMLSHLGATGLLGLTWPTAPIRVNVPRSLGIRKSKERE